MTISRRKTDENIGQILLRKMKSNSYILLLFVVVFIFVAIVHQVAPLSVNPINSEKNAPFESNWLCQIEDGEFKEIELPYTVTIPQNQQITLENVLPHDLVRGATVLFRTSQQTATVFIDGEEIYNTYDEEKNQPIYTSAYHFVRMPTDGASKQIEILLSSPYKKYAGVINEIYLGSKASNVFFVVGENGLRFIVGAFVSCIGLLLVIIFLFAKGANKSKVPVIYIGAFFVSAGLWVMMESKIAQFILPYPILLTNLSIFALTLMPIFIGLYYYTAHAKVFKNIVKYLIAFMLLVFLGVSATACIEPMMPMQLMPVYLAVLAIYTVIVFASIILETVWEGKIFSLSVCGISIFGICGTLELLLYVTNQKDYNHSTIMVFGLIMFCLLIVADTAQNYTNMYQDAIKVDTLMVLAYTDSLTNLKNRTAFLERMSTLNERTRGMVSIAMFDINNLKIVNDTMGHLVGDAMIIHSVKAMAESLRQEDELYRIGGDEFAAILLHETPLNLEDIEQRVVETMIRENKKNLSYEVSFAYGIATFSEEIDKTLYETLARADEKMYLRKKIQKGTGQQISNM